MQAHPGTINSTGGSDDRSFMIDLRHVQQAFRGVSVLVEMTLQVAAGEIFGLIGPSGFGKTTTVYICCGQWNPRYATSTTSRDRRYAGPLPLDH